MKASLISIVIALCLNAADIVVGLISAIKTKTVSSSTLRDGLFKKIGFIFCYALAFVLDYYGSYIGFNIGVNILPLVIAYTAITEITSILENVSEINPDLATSKLLALFQITKNDDSDSDKEDEE